MRHAGLLMAASLLLAGCSAAPTVAAAGATGTSGTTASAGQNGMELGSLVTGSNADAAAPVQSSSPDDMLAVTAIHYDCGNGMEPITQYDEYTDVMTLALDGRTYRLHSDKAASGGRYKADDGMSPGKSLVWWTKGTDAMLIQMPKGDSSGRAEKTLNCTERDG